MAMKSVVRQWLPKSSFVRSVSVLAGGTAAGQAVLVLVSPLLTRLYSPEDFGLLAVFGSLLTIFTIVASLRYELAIPLPESDEESSDVVALSVLIVLVMTVVSTVVVVLFGDVVAGMVGLPILAEYLWLLPIGVLLTGVNQVLYYWAIRAKVFGVIAKTRLTQSVAGATVQLGGYLLGPAALLFGRIVGQASGTVRLGAACGARLESFKHVRLESLRNAAVRYRNFPLFSTWGAVLNTAAKELPALLFAALFNASAAGIYMLANRVLAMPLALIGKSIAAVFLSHAAEARRKGELAVLVAGIHEQLAQVAMPPALMLMIAGPEMFAFVFGAEWRQAGEFARWMAPWLYFNFVTSPLSMVFSVLEKQAQGTAFQGILFLVNLAALATGAYFGDLQLAVALYALGGAACWAVFLSWMMRAAGNSQQVMIRASARALGWGVLLVSPLALAELMAMRGEMWLVAVAGAVVLSSIRYLSLARRAW